MTSVGPMAECYMLLKADLERQFVLEGTPSRRVDVLQILARAVHPRFLPLIACRLSRAFYLARIPVLPLVCSYVNLLMFGIQVTPRCYIGAGFFLPHPSGVVVGARRIGENVTLFHQVTLGAKELDMAFTPELLPDVGNNVTIGAGAKVLGGIHLGDCVVIGANSVVLHPVAPGRTAVGIPARAIEPSVSRAIS
jgi:serine O-acetyltransferase